MNRDDLQKKYGGGKNSYLCWPVYFGHIPGEFHLTCKFLGDAKYEVSDVVELLAGLDTSGPEGNDISWVNHTFDTKNDGLVKVMLIQGCPSRMKACHDALADLRKDDYPEWKAHVTVDEAIWDEVKEGGYTPSDFGITFGPLQLRRGDEVLHEWKEND
jgi:hypothetical protein